MKREYLEDLNQITANILKTLFQKEFDLANQARQEPIPSFDSKYLAQIGLRNKKIQVHVILGLSEATTANLLKDYLKLAKQEDEKQELAKSALGELANTVACDIATTNLMREDLGQLLPTPPLVWVTDNNRPDFIRGDGVSGYVEHHEQRVHTFIAIMPVFKIGNADLNSWSPTQSLSIYDPHSAE